jgi:uncharacterized damage-inducible protein DinB
VRKGLISLACLLTIAAVSGAQENPPNSAVAPPDNPLSAHSRLMYAGLKAVVLRSAEQVPEEVYGFRPTEAVRTFGQIVGHVADSQYYFCSIALGETKPSLKVEKTKTSKAELVTALKEAFAYCDTAYDGMTDASAAQTVKLFSGDTPKLGVLYANSVHTVEHYGNLVTYMRMKSIVPPTSDPAFMAQFQKK